MAPLPGEETALLGASALVAALGQGCAKVTQRRMEALLSSKRPADPDWVSFSCLISEVKKHIIIVLFNCQEFWVNLSFILTAT